MSPFLLSVLLSLAGLIASGIVAFHFPILAIVHALILVLLSYGIFCRQLFNPLQEQNKDLERQVQERTQELESVRVEIEKWAEKQAAEMGKEITERERVERTLQESEEGFRTIFDNLDDALVILDVDNAAIVDVNRKMCEMYGYTREEACRLNFDALSSGEMPYTQQDAMSWMKRALGGQPQVLEWQTKDKQGQMFWVETSMRHVVIRGQGRLLVDVHDVTERKWSEKVRASLYRISEDANLALDLEELFRSIHSIVGQLMFARNFYIALYDTAADKLSFSYWVDEHDKKPAPQSSGKSLTAFVIKTKKPLLASPQVFGELLDNDQIETVGTRPVDWLGVPLMIQEKIIGVLAVQSYTQGIRFQEEDKNVLMFVSTQVARAIERKQAEEDRKQLLADLRHRSTQLQTAAEVSKSAITNLDPDKLMERAVNLIQERFGFFYAGIFLVDEAGDYAVLRAGTGEAGREMVENGHRLAVGSASVIGWCTAHSEARIVRDAEETTFRFDNPWLPQVRSEMALPLRSHDRGCIGGLTVQSTEGDAFSQQDVAALQTMADQLAIAIENARLYRHVQRYAAEMEERVVERTAELAAVNKELEAFAYSVSHDLRAPLRAINGFSRALAEDYQDCIDATGLDYLQRVREASLRMGQLIDDLLKLSRVTRSELYQETVDLSAMAEQIIVGLQAAHPERQVKFTVGPGLVVEGDRRLLRIALENLLGNAWKFTGNKPVATIELGVTQVNGERVYFVQDDGAGFDNAYIHKLFIPFQRLHALAEFDGSGIGLATVQRILRRHSGRVWAAGAIDEGATFYFTL